MRLGVALLVSCPFVLASCTQGSSPATTFPALYGNYSGTLSDAVHGTVPITAALQQSGPSVGGTIVQAAIPNLTGGVSWRVSLSGAVTGTIVLTSAGLTCAFNTSAQVSGTTVSGSYTPLSGCAGESGSFQLMR